MEAGRGSSKPPPNVHLEEEKGDDNIIRYPSDRGRSETKDSQITPGPSGLITRPLAKIRYKSTRILQDCRPYNLTGLAGRKDSQNRSALVGPQIVKACSSNKDSDTPNGMGISSSKTVTDDHAGQLELDEQERPRKLKSGERLAACLEDRNLEARDIEQVRQQYGEAFELEHGKCANTVDRVPSIADQLTRLYESGETDYIASKEDLKAKIDLHEKWGALYREDTLDVHEKLTGELRRANLIADQVYEEIHTAGKLRLSDFENVLPNEYIMYLIESGKIKPGSLTLELGPGGGKDARTIAHMVANAQVNGVDISPTAVRAANSIAHREGLGRCVKMAQGNYLDILNGCVGQPYNNIYMNSVGHYSPGKKVEQLFEMNGNVLRESGGRLHCGMKIREGSASADSPYQIQLAPGHPDNPMIDVRHFNPETGKGAILRLYFETAARIHQLQRRGGLIIEDSQIRDVANYDRPGQSERFVWTTLRAA